MGEEVVMLSLGEFREFTSGMPETTELRIASIYTEEEIVIEAKKPE